MQAEILPLEGKYYGTQVRIFDPITTLDTQFEIWCNDQSGMSLRELDQARDALEMHTAPVEEVEREWICDGHYETKTSYRIANLIVAAINSGVIE